MNSLHAAKLSEHCVGQLDSVNLTHGVTQSLSHSELCELCGLSEAQSVCGRLVVAGSTTSDVAACRWTDAASLWFTL